MSDDKLIDLYSESIISLGFLEVYEDHDPSKTVLKHMHLRDFEGPMSGALYFTGYSEELAQMYIPDKEVVTYRDNYELLDKIKFYLNNEKQGELIRENGLKRSLSEHTYQRRYSKLFKEIGI